MFNKMPLKQKFIVLEGVALLMLMAMSIFSVVVLHGAVEDEKTNIERLDQDIQAMTAIDTMDIAILKEAKAAKDTWLRGDNAENIRKYREAFVFEQNRFEENHRRATEVLKKLAIGHEQDFAGFLSALVQIGEEHKRVSKKYLDQIDAHRGNGEDSDARVKGIDIEAIKQLKELRDKFDEFTAKKSREKIELAESDFNRRRTGIIIWVLVAFALSIGLSMLIVGQIMRQLGGDPREVAALVNTMAEGDFSRQPSQPPIPGSLVDDAYRMQQKLRDMIASVKQQSVEVGDMAHSLAASANQIAENVNHESDAVSSMAASIEELSVSTTHISDQGGNAKRIATESRSKAEEGAKVVNKTVAGLLETAREIETASGEVSRLGEDASRISDVVNVIKEIADQTNLLALNAAIEAARAGEQGRGFAVVADEVRKLAERTAGATSEINQMSDKIGEVAAHALSGMDKVVKTTRQGVGDAESAQASITDIQTNFGEVAGVIDDISGALQEQSVAATDLAKSTERVSQMSEENSGAAQGLLALANDLEKKALEVRQAVDVFKV
jgi:methyl-accepting chemotaxis protein